MSQKATTSETYPNIFTIFIPLCLILWFIFSIKRRNKKKLSFPPPPGPRGLPVVGYLPFLGSNLHQSFKELANIYGSIFKLKLATKECIVISSPSLVREVVKDQDVIFANRGEPTVALRSLLFGEMDIGFADYGSEWRKMRKAFVSQLMSNASLDAGYHLRKQHVNKMMHETYQKAGQLVDIGEIAFFTLVSSIMSMVWGDTLKGDEGSVLNAEFRALITKNMELLGVPNISDLFPLLARFDLQGIEHEMKKSSLHCEQILDSAINHHYTGENNQRKDFLGYLLQLTDHEDPATSLSLPQVKAILMDTLTGGTDTTAAMVEWAMAELLQQPKVLRKVQEELTEVVGLNSTVEEAHLPKLKYLNAVVKETLRLHPSLPLLAPRCPSKPSTVGGYAVPKGARIFLNVYAIHRDPQIWEDPLLFQPERFLNGPAAGDKADYLGKHFQYLPFGSGRRICAGIPLAERMGLLVLASLLHAFQWKLPDGTGDVDFSENFGIVVRKSKPLFAVPSPRLSNLELYSYLKA